MIKITSDCDPSLVSPDVKCVQLIEKSVFADKEINQAFPCSLLGDYQKKNIKTVLQSLVYSIGGEVFIPQLNSFKINTVVKAVSAIAGKPSDIKLIGLRPGEKLHEDMLAKTELDFTYHVPLDTKAIKLLQVRPQYTNKVYKDYKKYEGLEFNSFLHLNNNVDFLKDLIIKGIS